MSAKRYTDLVAWQLAQRVKVAIYALCADPRVREDRRFCDQIRDSAASATRNLAEGFGAFRHAEFARYARIAKASLTETHNHLGDGADRGHWPRAQAVELQKLTDRATGATKRLIDHLERSPTPGSL